jgi:serine protease Do
VGDWVIAIGNPFGLGGTVTAGIISAVYRNTGTGSAYDRYLQTDAAINRGNSGGPMFDMRGNVIGINNAIFSPTGGSVGIGFAIPAETAAPIVDKLMKGQVIERGYLGVRIQALSEDLAGSLGLPKKRGEFVQAVEPTGAAAKAGIQGGDVVVRVAGKDVTPEQTLSFIVANTAPGSRIPIDIIRDGKPMTIQAIVGKRPSEQELAQNFDPNADGDSEDFSKPGNGPSAGQKEALNGPIQKSLGLTVIPLTPVIARQLGATEATRGVVVSAVDDSSDAGAKGLQRGDIILSAGYHPVTTVADLSTAVATAKTENRVALLLRIQRRGQPALYLPVRLR